MEVLDRPVLQRRHLSKLRLGSTCTRDKYLVVLVAGSKDSVSLKLGLLIGGHRSYVSYLRRAQFDQDLVGLLRRIVGTAPSHILESAC